MIHRIIGLKKNPKTGEIDCKCEWKSRVEGSTEFPISSYVPMTSIRNKHPDVLIQFFEHAGKINGRFEECYPLYFPERAKELKDQEDQY